MADQPADIRERLGTERVRREGNRMWEALEAYHRSTSSSNRPDRSYRNLVPKHPPYTVGKPKKPANYPSNLWFVCQRLGIPYDPNWVHRSQHRGSDDNPMTITDITDESDEEVEGSPSVPVGSEPFVPETWVLDAEYLENSYLMNGSPDPESFLWELDVYDQVWISVGLILNDDAFKHVSILNCTRTVKTLYFSKPTYYPLT